ncbi:MAG: XdhC family protein [Desulfobacterales bacterium]|nr:XdhC family protein [Desulfobacterales bacterium]
MSEILQEIYQVLVDGQELVVATIISDSGSTPRTAGSKMLVYTDGRISGTIGGGAVEADVIRTARHLFETRGAVMAAYDLSQDGHADAMDLVCGGRITVLVEHVPVNNINIETYAAACEELKMSRPFFWIGSIAGDGARCRVARAVLTASNQTVGSFQPGSEMQKTLTGSHFDSSPTALVETSGPSYVIESIRPPDTIYLVGAGHVAQEIAALARQVGFRLWVFDDRPEFANPARFPEAEEIRICPGFRNVFDGSGITAGSYIVIVTRGHRFDKEVLAQALRTGAGYIGMIGSRRKKEHIFKDLIEEGFEPSALDQVFCPIGLPIEAETPAEIGVSVVAQLIQHRAGRKNRG